MRSTRTTGTTDVPVTPDDGFDSWCVRLPIDQRHRFFRLIQCDQRTAPIYNVIETGITPAQAGALADGLGIPQDELMLGDGSVRFLNPKKFQRVPTRPIQDEGIIEELRRGTTDDDGEMAFEAFDFDAIKNLHVPGGDEASEIFRRALLRAGIGPKPEDPATIGPKPEDPMVRHTSLDVVGVNGDPVVEDAKLDTNVCAYVATGVWHHWLTTNDHAFVERFFPVVERALDWVLTLQTPRGEVIWARHVDGKPWSYALLTGSSSISHALRCGVR